MKDIQGFTFTVGCKVARAVIWRSSPHLEICTVTKIDGDKLYLNGSKQAIRALDRLVIIDHDPLIKLVDEHAKEIKGV
jgi:hypothetical protein